MGVLACIALFAVLPLTIFKAVVIGCLAVTTLMALGFLFLNEKTKYEISLWCLTHGWSPEEIAFFLSSIWLTVGAFWLFG